MSLVVTRFFIWLGKTVATVAITVIVTLWLTGLMLTSVIQSVLEEYEIPLQVEPVIYSGVLGYLWGYQENEKNVASLDEQGNNNLLEEQITNNENTNNYSPAQIGENSADVDGDNAAVEVLAPIEMEEEVEISKNELGETKQALTDKEKERLLAIIVEKVPADQWQIISLYLEDGLSEKELLETQQILAQHLTDEEYRELMGILKKS